MAAKYSSISVFSFGLYTVTLGLKVPSGVKTASCSFGIFRPVE